MCRATDPGSVPACRQLHAWVDESMRTTGVRTPVYLLGASIGVATIRDRAEPVLRRLAPRGKKLHWRELGDAGKATVIEILPTLGLRHLVVVGMPLDGVRQERARGRCFTRLMWELTQRHVAHVSIESRSATLDAKDRRRVDGLRGSA